ncbi:MAG: DUF881 domain-containing protein [Micrococcales bacterium]|nr:DUF881 domain-containing protein [Micrococcales bacterium]
MAQGRHRPTRRRAVVSVAAVTALAGLLFATNARLLWGKGHSASALEGLAREESRTIATLTDTQALLNSEINALVGAQPEAVVLAEDPVMGVATGQVPVAGPGVVVTLDDAVLPAAPSAPLDDYVVHQQDIEAVLNTLWGAEAQAVAVQGVRVSSMTSIRCVGNVVLVGGRVSSPPYVIEAVGDSHDLVKALEEGPALDAYREAAEAIGLGWSVRVLDNVHLTGSSGGSIGLRYVSALDPDRGELP